MRRLARSMANHSHTLRFLQATKVHISSSSRASHSRRWAFFGRRRGRGGRAANAFFYQLGHRHARNAAHAHDAALGVALDQELFNLGVAQGPPRRRWHEAGLVATRRAVVLGVALATTIAPDMFTAAGGAEVLRDYHEPPYVFHH